MRGRSKRDADGDASDPRSERTVAAPAGKCTERDHEGFLRGVLGVSRIPEDPMTSAQDHGRLTGHEDCECIPVSAQNGRGDAASLVVNNGLYIGGKACC